MLNARLMDRPEDFQKLGINPDAVELWEEGRRTTGDPGQNEVWYFDGQLEDGTKYIVGFRPKALERMAEKQDSPNVNVVVTAPDGTKHADFHYFEAEGNTTSTEKCECRYGTDWCVGNYASYDIHFEPTNGVGVHLHYDALCEPFRQGTGINAFGDSDEFFHTDISVPKNRVTGTVTYGGEVHEVTGVGYHDHQWMNASPMALYHHWLWGRMYTDAYTVYIYDFVAGERYGFKRLPMFGLIDNETGKVVFKTDGAFELRTELEPEAQTGREFPKVSHYRFQNADGSRVELDIEWTEQIELTDYYTNASESVKRQYDAMGAAMIYTRYFAKGEVRFDKPGEAAVKSAGEMIYEYAYIGRPNENAHV